MYIQKIKTIWDEKKRYIWIGLIIVISIFVYLHHQQSSKVDNSELISSKIQKKNNLKSSTNSRITNFKTTTLICDISGAVNKSGVYSLKANSRLNDLIIAAGGLQKNAQIKQVNRALKLKDQDHVYIPYEGEKLNTSGTNPNDISDNNESEKININSATASDFQKLNGIGQKRAEQIVEFRNKNGDFKDTKDLTKISGIGDKTFEKLKDQLEI